MSVIHTEAPLTETQNGNPYLKAITSDAADVSLEWYAGKGVSASAAGFYKHVSGFVGSAQFPTTIGGSLAVFISRLTPVLQNWAVWNWR
jgi:outer membrane receptor protein involved in Fe transport